MVELRIAGLDLVEGANRARRAHRGPRPAGDGERAGQCQQRAGDEGEEAPGGDRDAEQHAVSASEDGVAVDPPAEVAEARVPRAARDALVDHQRQCAEPDAEERERERDAVTSGAERHRARARSLTGPSPAFNPRTCSELVREAEVRLGAAGVQASEAPRLED